MWQYRVYSAMFESFWNYKVLLIRYRVLGRDNEKRLRQGLASFSAFEISAFSTMDMLFLGGPGDHFLFISSFCTSLWGPTCYYLCSTQYGYCKDSDAISILFLQIAFLHQFRQLRNQFKYNCFPTDAPKLRFWCDQQLKCSTVFQLPYHKLGTYTIY